MRNILVVTTTLVVMVLAAVGIRTDLKRAAELKMTQDAEIYRTQVADLTKVQIFYEKERSGRRDERVVYRPTSGPQAPTIIYRWCFNQDRELWDDVFMERSDAPQSRTRLEIVPEDVKFYWVQGRIQALKQEPELFRTE
jgi:hypothetical protein